MSRQEDRGERGKTASAVFLLSGRRWGRGREASRCSASLEGVDPGSQVSEASLARIRFLFSFLEDCERRDLLGDR